jgi:hypothetical protein
VAGPIAGLCATTGPATATFPPGETGPLEQISLLEGTSDLQAKGNGLHQCPQQPTLVVIRKRADREFPLTPNRRHQYDPEKSR